MSAHAVFSPSSAHRWINCPGSMAYPENRTDGDHSTHADNGTASHEWAAYCLKESCNAEKLLGAKITLNGADYVMDEERAGYVQDYLDWVRSFLLREDMFIEHRVSMRPLFDSRGTVDVGGYNRMSNEVLAIDLKYGVGEKVYAEQNAQGLSYLIGLWNDMQLLGIEPAGFRIGIAQPRLNHFDMWPALDKPPLTLADLEEFGDVAEHAIFEGKHWVVGGPDSEGLEKALFPDAKTCRWCRVKATCPALTAKVQAEMRAEFDDVIVSGTPDPARDDAERLSKAFAVAPLVDLWVDAVRAEVNRRVAAGVEILGTDGQPLKFVEGKQGDRKWINENAAEAALVGVLGPKAYQPQKILTAAGAAKILDKKKTEATWEVFKQNISRAPGRPVLALGSDTRPPFGGVAASADDFEIQEE